MPFPSFHILRKLISLILGVPLFFFIISAHIYIFLISVFFTFACLWLYAYGIWISSLSVQQCIFVIRQSSSVLTCTPVVHWFSPMYNIPLNVIHEYTTVHPMNTLQFHYPLYCWEIVGFFKKGYFLLWTILLHSFIMSPVKYRHRSFSRSRIQYQPTSCSIENGYIDVRILFFQTWRQVGRAWTVEAQ